MIVKNNLSIALESAGYGRFGRCFRNVEARSNESSIGSQRYFGCFKDAEWSLIRVFRLRAMAYQRPVLQS